MGTGHPLAFASCAGDRGLQGPRRTRRSPRLARWRGLESERGFTEAAVPGAHPARGGEPGCRHHSGRGQAGTRASATIRAGRPSRRLFHANQTPPATNQTTTTMIAVRASLWVWEPTIGWP